MPRRDLDRNRDCWGWCSVGCEALEDEADEEEPGADSLDPAGSRGGPGLHRSINDKHQRLRCGVASKQNYTRADVCRLASIGEDRPPKAGAVH